MRYEPFVHPKLLAVAAAQRGVFSSQQAYAAGHTPYDVQQLRRAGHLLPLRRGIYTLPAEYTGADASRRHAMQVAALALALSAPAVLTHQSAAAELGLALLDPDLSQLHVTRPLGLGSRREAGVVHHIAELLPDDVTGVHGCPLPLSGPARTAVDVARETTRFECALAAVDSALRLGVSRDELEAVMERCRSWPGARLAGGAVSMADGRADNPGESWSRAVLIAVGLPPDDLQVAVSDSDGLIGYADFGWEGVLGEFDGKLKYAVPAGADPASAGAVVWKEKRREDRMRAAHEFVRWGFADILRPERLGARIRAAMARATASGRRRTAIVA